MKCYYVFHSQNLRFNRKFMEDLTKEIETQNRNLKNWRICFPICNGVFKKHTLGKRYLRANHKTFVNTESWLGQNLEIASLKTCDESKYLFEKQKNQVCKTSVKKWKPIFFITKWKQDNRQKSFWKTAQSFYLQQE